MRALTLAGLVLLATAALPRRAAAVRPGDWVIGLAPSYAYIVIDSKAQPRGVGANAVLLYGLTESFAARLSGGWSGHSVETDKPNPPLYQVAHATLGLRYAFDLVKINPSIEGGVGILYQQFGKASSTDLGLQLGVAFDYWVLRWLSVGAYFHYYAFLSNPTQYPVYFDAGPRVEVRWR